jgi:hypothetical protein
VFQAGGTGTFDAGQVIVQFSSANSASVQNIIATTQSSGAFKTTLGYNAGGSGTGAFNTCIGQTAGQSLTTAQGNTLIGSQAGLGITTGNNNTIVGSYQGSAALANTFAAYDGAGNNKLTVSQTNALSIGTSGTGAIGSVLTSQGSGQVTWTYTNVLEYAFYTQSSTIPTTSQDVFFANCSAGSFTLTLPPASGNGGKAFYIKRTDTVVANTLNIASSGGLIEGASSSTQGPGVAVYYISDGTNWWELANG